MISAQEFLKTGRLGDALIAVQNDVRSNPADSKPRILLFQLLCVLGNWERALTQLQVLGEMDADCALMAAMFRPLIQCEAFRAEVFNGKRTPLIFGEPLPWLGPLVEALKLTAQDRFDAARTLCTQAFDAAPSVPGQINDTPFEWIADADSRLGPVLEAILDGKYYWIPFCRIKRIRLQPPQDLRDLVWLPAGFIWANGGEASGYIPTRYPGSESVADDALRLARRTEWIAKPAELFFGLGQRIFTTDQTELPLLEIRSIDF
jgi:type VI secretion system protein ImpE